MADHAKFIGHLLDPSERKLVDTARNFSNDFDALMYQAIDLESMKPQSQTVPLLDRFLDQIVCRLHLSGTLRKQHVI